jgi:hypothetical protein
MRKTGVIFILTVFVIGFSSIILCYNLYSNKINPPDVKIVEVNPNFESGSAQNLRRTGVNDFTFELKSDPYQETWWFWSGVKVINAKNQIVTFHVTNVESNYLYEGFRAWLPPVYSYGGPTWLRFENYTLTQDKKVFSFTQRFTSDNVTIHTFYPYYYSDLKIYLSKISSLSYVQNEVVGMSEEGREIYVTTITEGESRIKKDSVDHCRATLLRNQWNVDCERYYGLHCLSRWCEFA